MARIATNKTKKIDLGDGEYLEVREQLSFAELQPILVGFDSSNETANIKMALPLLELAIVNWCIKNDDGTEVPFTKEAIQKLDAKTVTENFVVILQQYFPEKKS